MQETTMDPTDTSRPEAFDKHAADRDRFARVLREAYEAHANDLTRLSVSADEVIAELGRQSDVGNMGQDEIAPLTPDELQRWCRWKIEHLNAASLGQYAQFAAKRQEAMANLLRFDITDRLNGNWGSPIETDPVIGCARHRGPRPQRG